MTEALSVARAARDIAADLAPDETAALDTYLALYQADPSIVGRLARSGGGDATGFGVPGDSLAPYIVGVVSATFTYLGKPMADALRAETTKWFRRRLRTAFNRSGRTAAPELPADRPPLTPEQLKAVRKVAFRTARDFDLPRSQADRLADALAGRLALRDGR